MNQILNEVFNKYWEERENPRHTFQYYFIIIFIFNIENDISYIYVTNDEKKDKMGTREFRDPIYNFIHILPDEIDPYEKNIIDSPFFQRLRYVRQLGLSSYIYPGASHTRFEHSLGTMEIATKLFDSLREKNKDIFIKDKETGKGLFEHEDEIKRYRQILRVACLLHDIGHYPFSHSSEEIWGKNHEAMGRDIILSESMKNLIEKKCPFNMKIKTKEIAFVATGKPETDDGRLHFLHKILTGDLGVDRIDYLVRDSLHTGVLYGVFDYHRLLDTFLLYIIESEEEKEVKLELCLDKGGVHAAEGLILARYFMFKQVYYHKTRSIYDLHLKNYLKEFIIYSKTDYNQINNFLKLNDVTILNQMKKDMDLHKGVKRGDLARSILGRQHHKFVDEINAEDLVVREDPDRIYNLIERKIAKKYPTEVKKGKILFDRSMKKPYKFKEADFYIYNDDELNHICVESELIERLKKIDLFRVYIARGKEGMGEEIKKIMKTTIKPYIKRGR